MGDVPEEFRELVKLGFQVEVSDDFASLAPSENAMAYLGAEMRERGYAFWVRLRPGLPGDVLASLEGEVRRRTVNLIKEGPNGPYEWSKSSAAPGYYIWLSRYRF